MTERRTFDLQPRMELLQGEQRGDPSIFQYIYGEWLPHSSYRRDNRPHFGLLGELYKGDSADSEEEIWIPVIR